MYGRQFSLRAFLFGVGLFAAFCGGWTANEIYRQRQGQSVANQVSTEMERKLRPIMNDLRIASDKLVRKP
jgi:hypothetical protein